MNGIKFIINSVLSMVVIILSYIIPKERLWFLVLLMG